MKYAALTLACIFSLALAGCREEEQIQSYTVPKPHVLQSQNPGTRVAASTSKDRMLAAILPKGEQAWFFKLTGEADSVGKHVDTFTALVKSTRIEDSGDPEWELPQGWQQLPGNSFRFATVKIPDDEKLDLSVSRLPWDPANEEQMVLENINRWRGQLGLPPLVADQLASQTQQFDVDGLAVTQVDMQGQLAASGMMGRAPFAGGPAAASGAAPAAAASSTSTPTSDEHAATDLKFDTPEGWTPGRSGGLRKAAFEVAKDDRKVEITVIPLEKSAGELASNVNRWRGQIGLEAISEAEIREQTETIQVDDAQGQYIAIEGSPDADPRQMILAVIAVHGDQAWFVKLQGDAELAKQEQERFEAFTRSIKFH